VNASAVQFIVIELDLAMTFCKVGLATKDIDRAMRNVEIAQTALDSAVENGRHLSISDGQARIIAAKRDRARILLRQLERRIKNWGVVSTVTHDRGCGQR
jgi:peptidyl-tRNA hydrolase